VEYFTDDQPGLPRCVEEELYFGTFAVDDCSERLRTPRDDVPANLEAQRAVAETMPYRYGQSFGKPPRMT
jgi:hypothetical protein